MKKTRRLFVIMAVALAMSILSGCHPWQPPAPPGLPKPPPIPVPGR